jgi:hypothetical protein
LSAVVNSRFRTRPLTDDVDPAAVDEIDGTPVVERLVTRPDRRGAVVRLATGQLAVLGESVAIGAPKMLKLWATRRLRSAKAPADRAWWKLVRQVVAAW